jgi:hypothetical protein
LAHRALLEIKQKKVGQGPPYNPAPSKRFASRFFRTRIGSQMRPFIAM